MQRLKCIIGTSAFPNFKPFFRVFIIDIELVKYTFLNELFQTSVGC